MIFNKEHIPLIMDQLKEEGFKPRSDPGSQYLKVDVPPPTRLQLMDVSSDVDRRTKSCIGSLNKIRSNTAARLTKAVENEFIDQNSKKKIPEETLSLLKIQKDMMIKQLIQFPELYYTKSYFPLEISQRAFDHLWRVCESYEMWCKETGQEKLIKLNLN